MNRDVRGVSLRRRPRPETWILLVMVIVVVATWCIGWGRYSATWSQPRIVPTEPGAWVPTSGGRIRVVSIDQRPEIIDGFSGPLRQEGEVFVVARFEFHKDPGDVAPDCRLSLVFDDGMVVNKPGNTAIRDVPSYCLGETDVEVGEAVFAIPVERAEHVIGVGHAVRFGEMQLLRPA